MRAPGCQVSRFGRRRRVAPAKRPHSPSPAADGSGITGVGAKICDEPVSAVSITAVGAWAKNRASVSNGPEARLPKPTFRNDGTMWLRHEPTVNPV